MNKPLLGSLLLLSLLLAQPMAHAYDYTYGDADPDAQSSFYAGAGLGLMAGDAWDVCKNDVSCVSRKAFLGYRASDLLAFEGGYHNLFRGRANNTTKLEASALSLSALAFMPYKDSVDLFGKLGFAAWNARANGLDVSNGTDVLLGAGAQMKMTENVGVRGEVEYVGGDLDSTNLGVGVTYSTY